MLEKFTGGGWDPFAVFKKRELEEIQPSPEGVDECTITTLFADTILIITFDLELRPTETQITVQNK